MSVWLSGWLSACVYLEHRFDFFVLVAGWMQILLEDRVVLGNFSFFRALRILKVIHFISLR